MLQGGGLVFLRDARPGDSREKGKRGKVCVDEKLQIFIRGVTGRTNSQTPKL